MAHRHTTVIEAYTALGLDQGSSLEVVKSTYKQLALKTHPDKNPGDTDATSQFQKLSEAYNVLLKHLDRSSSPPLRHAHPHSYSHNHDYDHTHSHTYSPFNPFEEYDFDEYDDHEEEDEDGFYSDDDFYDDYDDYDDYEAERLAFYRWLFEEALRGHDSRHAHSRFHRQQRDPRPSETQDQYTARLRKAREDQERAAERRAQEEAARKANQEKQRERERRDAEERQRQKAFAKKAEAEASRRNAEQKARAQQEKLQATRSKVFAAARRGDASAVKKGIWEDNVDAAGGELRRGAEAFVKSLPVDPKQTLLHIVAKKGDADLVEWLTAHSADPEERDGQDMTAFHVALVNKRPAVIQHLFESYPPGDEDYEAVYRRPENKSNISLALDTREPELVWMVLDKRLHTKEEMDKAWDTMNKPTFKSSVSPLGKFDELVNLFVTYGKYEPSIVQAPLDEPTPSPPPQAKGKRANRPHPTVTVENVRTQSASPISEQPQTPSSASPTGTRPSRGRGNRGRPYQPRPQQKSYPPSPNVEQSANPLPMNESPQGDRPRGRGRGRGQYRGRGRGRGRGQAPARNQPPPA
ncbi:hypothetical protein C8Q77DRAFT_1095585 [Trametes polyzona]|nr:hypothetical protein C8Q77DRAFT_1095585 [Trametes polyzona]